MDNKLYLVYEGDACLSRHNLVLMGIYDNIELAIQDILEEMSENGMLDGKNNRDDVAKELSREHQTFGFDKNYMIESVHLNEWGEI